MRDRVWFPAIALAATMTLSAALLQAQTPQTRIPQQIVINGQNATGAYVTTADGRIQGYTCPSPQQYVIADGSAQGWACYEQSTGVWLLHAAPPQAQAAAPAPAPPPPAQVVAPPPVVIYQPAPATIVYTQPVVIYAQPVPVFVQRAAPAVVFASPRPVIVGPGYPSSVILGTAAINAAGRVASSAIISSNVRGPVLSGYSIQRGKGRR